MGKTRRLPACGPPLLAVLLVPLMAVYGAAQGNRAAIAGTVADAQGAVVSGATVTATNVATGVTRHGKTADDGRYSFGAIFDPGTYTVKVESQGFKTATSEQIVLQIGDVREVNIALEPGAVSDSVTVTAQAPLIETETSVRGETITGRQITELPLNGRNFSSFATLIPGVTRAVVGAMTDASAFQGSVSGLSEGSTESARFSRSQGSSLSINGLRPANNSFTLDGVDNNEAQYGQIGVFPPPDAIQEFKVETSVPPAEEGRGNGFINTTFRSGTNTVHGSAYYFHRNDFLDASPVFSRLSTTDPVTGRPAVSGKPPRRENEFGFTLGAPVWIPKLYNGQNKTFFFVDYQGQRNKYPFERGSPFTTVPTQLSRTGDFSEFGGVNVPGVGKVNKIPAGRIDPVALKYLQAFPLPNFPQNGVNNNYLFLRHVNERINAFDARVDHNASTKQVIFTRVSVSNQFRDRESFFPVLPAGFGAGNENGSTRQVAIGDTYSFTPTLINEFRFGYTRVFIGINECGVRGACGISPTISADLGIPHVNVAGDPNREGGAGIGTSGNAGIEFTGDGGPFVVPSNNYYYSDSVTSIHGNHTVKAGGQLRFRQVNAFDGGRTGPAKGFIGFGDNDTGNAQANILLGRASFSAAPQVNGPFTISYHEYGFFAQDDWKVSPRLTLNLGLRYDLFTNPTERFNRFGNYDFATRTIKVAGGAAGRSLVNLDKNNFGPRIGFAYALDKERNFVLRGGWGVLYFQDAAEFPPLALNPPNGSPVFLGGTDLNNKPVTLSTGPPLAQGNNDPVNLQQFASYRFVDPHNRTAYTQQYNLTLQWQFARTWVLDAGYQGSSTKHLLATRNLGSGDFQDGSFATGLGLARDSKGNPLAFLKAYENRAASSYNSLQVRLEKRLSAGLVMINAYTWSHTLDETSGDFGAIAEARGDSGGPQNPFCIRCEKGNSGFDYRHRFTSSVVYDLPIGKGRKFLNNGGLEDKIVGGFQVNFITIWQSGQAYSVVMGNGRRPDVIGDPLANIPPGLEFNPSAFAPPSGRVKNLDGSTVEFGNLGRNTFRGPRRFNTDFSLFKNTALGERVKLQLGIEFFNFFNNVQKVVPNNSLNFDSNGKVNLGNQPGRIFNAYPPREGQLRAKIIF